jgi:hypothetical protein
MQVTLALSPKEVKIVKCNGNNLNRNKKKHDVYALHPDYLSQSIVVIGVFHLPPSPFIMKIPSGIHKKIPERKFEFWKSFLETL